MSDNASIGDLFGVFDGSVKKVDGKDADFKEEDREENRKREREGENGEKKEGELGGESVKVAKKDQDDEVDGVEKTEEESRPLGRPKSYAVEVPTYEGKSICSHDVSLPSGWTKDQYDFEELETMSNPKPAKKYKFSLDSFQAEAVKCLEKGESVLVSAHTSAGKTVVAEYAIAMSLKNKQRVIYTSPIKALSNQKYRELHEEFEDVGLMTGDITISPNSSCLVMTTEILRSMLYRGSEVVREIAWVIFDEVHYMRDKERGVVWEEAIIMVPKNVRFVFLSATIPNAQEFSEWISEIKQQPCHTIYTSTRPVPLQHYMFPAGGEGLHFVVDEKGNFREENFARALAEIGGEGGGGGGEKNGGGDEGKKRIKKKGNKGPSDVYKVVKLIRDRNYDPVIVFAFSKRDCETLALQMAKLDFNDEDEKKLVQEVFTHAMDSLSEEDQKLPQLTAALPLLQRGIGIHHSGLLPILKEVVEILFGEGLIKALFATETFSMGLNMPAKTVVFVAARKYDGESFRWLSGGEYIQMSGRAGRRGLDARGIAILMFDEKMEPDQAKNILKGNADPLKSSFHLGYNMLLNLLRAEEADPRLIISKSFAQFQADRALPETEAKLAALESSLKSIDLGEIEEDLAEHTGLTNTRERLRAEIRAFVFKPQYVVPFLQPGRLVGVNDIAENENFGWGVIINFTKRSNPGKNAGDSADRYIVDVLLKCSPGTGGSGNQRAKPADASEKGEWVVVPCSLKMFEKISAIRVYVPKDLKPKDHKAAVGKSVGEVEKRFTNQIPELDPREDQSIKEERFVELLRKVETVEDKLATSTLQEKLKKDGQDIIDVMKQYSKKLEIEIECKRLRRLIKLGRGHIMKEELIRMKRVLRRTGFISSGEIVEMKGRTACEINTADELVITELMLDGNFNDLKPEVVVSLLSCFVFDEKADESLTLEPSLQHAYNLLKEVALRIGTITQECKIPIDVDEYVQSFEPSAMPVMYAWACGKSFSEICKMTTMFEGSIVRCMRRLEELLLQLRAASKSIGNTELQEKFEQGSEKLKRGVAFQASLYL